MLKGEIQKDSEFPGRRTDADGETQAGNDLEPGVYVDGVTHPGVQEEQVLFLDFSCVAKPIVGPAGGLRHQIEMVIGQVDHARAVIDRREVGPCATETCGAGKKSGPVALNHPVDPTPSFDQVTLSFSLPLPLWNQNRAGIAAARHTAGQAQKQLEAAELKAQVQLRQAHLAYRSGLDRLTRYRGGILQDAEAVLDARRFSYQRGQSTLLEVLEAQRAAAEVRAGYTGALADAAKAFIELERAAGHADVEF